ncbi:MAG: arginine--tRNA ligase [Candidatus Paceibacterota bacterium]|jgi:arginyl-tRNA synthetase
MKNKIENLIQEALKKLSIENIEIILEHPNNLNNGDFTTNIAMVCAKKLEMSPIEIAKKIVDILNENKPEEIEKIEVAHPGFINFYLSKKYFIENTEKILKEKENYGKGENLKGQTVLVEYTDPNPFKLFHTGHLMTNAVGEAISRIIEWNGALIKRLCYQGDVGLHVAKTIWGIKNDPEWKEKFEEIKNSSITEKIAWLGEAYSKGALSYEDNEDSINDINKKIYEKTDEEVNELYDLGKKWSLEYFDQIYKKLGTKFDHNFFESEAAPIGQKLVEENIGGVFEKSDGAIIFKGENYGLHTRVFINSEGLPTYEAKELGLAKMKGEKYSFDKSIIITGNEVNDYFKVLLKVMELILPDYALKTKHISHGMLRLPSGKMSSRTGQVVTAESLIDGVKKIIFKKLEDRDFNEDEKEKIAEQVSIGAIKFSILKQSIGKDIIFDFEKSLSFEGDSGPYLQYSFARANSVLEKAKKLGMKIEIPALRNLGEAGDLEKVINQFPNIVERAGNEYAPNYLITYLLELVSAFNAYYRDNKIIDTENKESSYRLALTEAFKTTLENGLNILGIPNPERM